MARAFMIEPMRCLVLTSLALALALTTTAHARVVRIQRLADLCPGHADWAKVAACIRRHGPMTVERTDDHVRLVRIGLPSRLAGLYLYTHDTKWAYLGELRMYSDFELLGFSRVRFGKHTGYRVDAGFTTATGASFDGQISTPAVLRRRLSLICFADTRACFNASTVCDVLAHGKAYYTFRGELVYEDHALHLVGDRSNAGPQCTQVEELFRDQ